MECMKCMEIPYGMEITDETLNDKSSSKKMSPATSIFQI